MQFGLCAQSKIYSHIFLNICQKETGKSVILDVAIPRVDSKSTIPTNMHRNMHWNIYIYRSNTYSLSAMHVSIRYMGYLFLAKIHQIPTRTSDIRIKFENDFCLQTWNRHCCLDFARNYAICNIFRVEKFGSSNNRIRCELYLNLFCWWS